MTHLDSESAVPEGVTAAGNVLKRSAVSSTADLEVSSRMLMSSFCDDQDVVKAIMEDLLRQVCDIRSVYEDKYGSLDTDADGDDLEFALEEVGFVHNPSPESTQAQIGVPGLHIAAQSHDLELSDQARLEFEKKRVIYYADLAKKREAEIEQLKDVLRNKEKEFTAQRAKLAQAKSENAKLTLENEKTKEDKDKLVAMRKQLAIAKSDAIKAQLKAKNTDVTSNNQCPAYIDFFWNICNEREFVKHLCTSRFLSGKLAQFFNEILQMVGSSDDSQPSSYMIEIAAGTLTNLTSLSEGQELVTCWTQLVLILDSIKCILEDNANQLVTAESRKNLTMAVYNISIKRSGLLIMAMRPNWFSFLPNLIIDPGDAASRNAACRLLSSIIPILPEIETVQELAKTFNDQQIYTLKQDLALRDAALGLENTLRTAMRRREY